MDTNLTTGEKFYRVRNFQVHTLEYLCLNPKNPREYIFLINGETAGFVYQNSMGDLHKDREKAHAELIKQVEKFLQLLKQQQNQITD